MTSCLTNLAPIKSQIHSSHYAFLLNGSAGILKAEVMFFNFSSNSIGNILFSGENSICWVRPAWVIYVLCSNIKAGQRQIGTKQTEKTYKTRWKNGNKTFTMQHIIWPDYIWHNVILFDKLFSKTHIKLIHYYEIDLKKKLWDNKVILILSTLFSVLLIADAKLKTTLSRIDKNL